MQKHLSRLLIFSLLFYVCACKNNASPGDVAKNFARAITAQNFQEAKEYSTSESATSIDMLEKLSKQIQLPDSLIQILKDAEVKVTNEKISDSIATVDVNITLKKEVLGSQEQTETIRLKKENGVWKVDFGSLEAQQPNISSDTTAPTIDPLPTKPDSAEQ